MKTLADLKKGERAVIKEFKDLKLSKRLIDFGCLPGEIIQLLKVAPLGCPWALEVSGFQLSLRKQEAMNVLVEILP